MKRYLSQRMGIYLAQEKEDNRDKDMCFEGGWRVTGKVKEDGWRSRERQNLIKKEQG